MTYTRATRFILTAAALAFLAACSGGGLFGGQQEPRTQTVQQEVDAIPNRSGSHTTGDTSLFDALRRRDLDRDVAVNRYIWNASLEVLSFLPVESVDPFSGIMVFGYGTPPGGGRAYRATVHVKDPALDARSLLVSIQTRNGPVAEGTRRAVEDAILTRARQLRVADKRF